MRLREIELGGVELLVPERWYDMTGEVDSPDAPYTLADSAVDIGALQFSFAFHEEGPLPLPSEQDLLEMARELGEQQALGTPDEEATFSEGALRGAGVSFHCDEYFIRVWYVSDGKNIAKVSYTCEWGQQGIQRPTCEDIVRSMRFPTS